MNKLTRDFVSEDSRDYKFKIGSLVASSLAGFIAGFIVASIIFVVLFTFIKINAL
jgi:tetrahydromethanopterin S-methyltransferase subunit F